MPVSASDQYAYINLSSQVVNVSGGEVNDRGVYSQAEFYAINDVVEYLNSLYICLTPNSAQPPTAIVDDNWSAFVQTTGEAPLTIEQLYEIVLQNYQVTLYGTQLAYTALETAWTGTALANTAIQVAYDGTNAANLALTQVNNALTVAYAGTELAYTALQTAWTGTNTANSINIISAAANGTDISAGRSGDNLRVKSIIPGVDVYIEDYGTAVEIGSTGPSAVPVGLEGEAYIFVGGDASGTVNGDALVAAHTAAKTKTPHGQALSANNRYTIFLLPGNYTLTDDALQLDTSYIDLIGLGKGREAYLTSSGNTLRVTSSTGHNRLANLTIHTSAAATNSNTGKHAYSGEFSSSASTFEARNVLFTSNNNYNAMKAQAGMYGTYIDCECDKEGGFNCAFQSWSSSVGLYGKFIRCKAKTYSFGATFNVNQTVTLSGQFIQCEAEEDSFGKNQTYDTTMSGYFHSCRVNSSGGYCFGHVSTAGRTLTMSGIFIGCVDVGNGFCFGNVIVHGNVTMSGIFMNCTTNGAGFGTNNYTFGSSTGTRLLSGVFMDCRTTGYGFGGGTTAGGTTTLSGRFVNCEAVQNVFCFGYGANTDCSGYFFNCRAGGEAFGTGGGVASGTFIGCVAGAGSFGGTDTGSSTGGTASGTFISCVGGAYSFGGADVSGSPGTMSGTMQNCVLTGLLYATVTGKIENMRIEATGSNQNAVLIGSNGRLYGCTLIKTGTGYAISGTGSITAKVAHCRMNSGPDPGFTFTNGIETPYNVVDSDIT